MTICKWFFSLHLKFPSKWIPRKVVQCKSAADRSPPQPHPHIIIIIDVHMQRKKRRKNWKKKKEAASKCRRNCFMLIASLPKLFLFFFFFVFTTIEWMWRCVYDMIYGKIGYGFQPFSIAVASNCTWSVKRIRLISIFFFIIFPFCYFFFRPSKCKNIFNFMLISLNWLRLKGKGAPMLNNGPGESAFSGRMAVNKTPTYTDK